MAKRTIIFRENSFVSLNADDLKTKVKLLSKDPHFILGQELTIKTGWGTGEYDTTNENGEHKITESVGLIATNSNGEDEFISVTMFKGKTRRDNANNDVVVNPNKVERDEDVINHVPTIGDKIYYVGKKYQNFYNRQTVVGAFSWTKNPNLD